MNTKELERILRAAGAVLVRTGKHKVYSLKGERFLLSLGERNSPHTARRTVQRLRRLTGTLPGH